MADFNNTQVRVTVYPEHFIVSVEHNGGLFEGSSETLSEALIEAAEELQGEGF